jgi:hypothetical protein
MAATTYPPPENPGVVPKKPKGPFKTHKVCPKLTKKAKKAGCKYTIIQQAVDAAKPGDTIKVADGTYGEGVIVEGGKKAARSWIKFVGNPKNPGKVVIDANKIPKKFKYKSTTVSKDEYRPQVMHSNAIAVRNAHNVSIDGFTAKNQTGNGFFFLNVNGYTMNHLVAAGTGIYGLYAFHSVGGVIKNSVGYHVNDGGFYIGETPPQDKPVRTIVDNVYSFGNVLGWSGTNMRYVTIKNSYFWNNGAGIVPNALTSEDFPPPEDNVITNNDIFLNNFDYYAGAPFERRETSAGGIPYPVGVGVLVFGGRRNEVSGNRIYGNKMLGAGAIQGLAIVEAMPTEANLEGNTILGNTFGNGGANRNGRDIGSDGNGVGNCYDPAQNTGAETPFPSAAVLASGCASTTTPNVFDQEAQLTAIGWATAALGGGDAKSAWIRYDQAPVKNPLNTNPKAPIKDPTSSSENIVPLEVYGG